MLAFDEIITKNIPIIKSGTPMRLLKIVSGFSKKLISKIRGTSVAITINNIMGKAAKLCDLINPNL